MAHAKKINDVWTIPAGGQPVSAEIEIDVPVLDEAGQSVRDEKGQIVTQKQIENVVVSYDAIMRSNAETLALFGLYLVGEGDPIPEGKRALETMIGDQDNRPVWVHALEDIPPYVAPVPESISDRQFAEVLSNDEIITRAEAKAWVKTGDLPAALQIVIDQIPDDDIAYKVELLLMGATTFERHHDTTPMLAYMLSKPEKIYDAAALDDLWIRCDVL